MLKTKPIGSAEFLAQVLLSISVYAPF